MSEPTTHERYMETGYNSEAWHYRHGIAWGTVFLFSLFVLCVKTLWGGVRGLVSGFAECWQGDIKPLFAKPANTPPVVADKPQEPAAERDAGE
ncbi:MAG: hypothetical protein J6N67_05110 [Desulfovibrio sp.]|nr:hypothetical protein [Desulfovibrio sp.]MBO6171519.1 hypothetical protein [Desulfovibrio sp.]